MIFAPENRNPSCMNHSKNFLFSAIARRRQTSSAAREQVRLRLQRLFFLCTIFLLPVFSLAQEGRQIKLRHADKLKGSREKNVQLLIGHVEFEHQGAIMTCDSAIFYNGANKLDAFGHVHIQHGDSVHLYGDMLKYNGNERKAELFKNISLTDGDMRLTTDYLIYDLKNKTASYNTGGKILNKDNTLESKLGYYSTESKTLTFRKDVKLFNPQYTMTCDTLRYLPISKVAYFIGPTTIKGNNNFIYCEDGWYDTKLDQCRFSKNSYLVTEGQKLSGDSLFYDRKIGVGRAKGNVVLLDTAQHLIIKGGLAVHNELTERSLVTQDALFIQAYDNDSLFLHADTLRAHTLRDSSVVTDENGKKVQLNDSNRVVYAHHHVKFFKQDLQGKCDSLVYSSLDSTMRMYGRPVLWSDENQLSAETIDIITTKNEVKQMFLYNTAFISSKEDTLRYNQIKGKKMTGWFSKNDLYRIDVEGNGQTLYYVRDKGSLVGVNKADCSRLTIQVADSKVKKINFYNKPEGVLYPLLDLSPREALLKDFRWRGEERPLQMRDIFVQ